MARRGRSWGRGAGVAGLALVGLLGATAWAEVPKGFPELAKALQLIEPRAPTPAPDVTLRTLDGRRLAIRALRGQVVLVNFWATWCVPCQWEMPLMERLYQAYRTRGFLVVAIALDQDEAAVRTFVSERGLTYPILLDPTFEAARQFGVRGLPATFLLGKDGSLKGATYGPREWDSPEARALVEVLLAAKAPAPR